MRYYDLAISQGIGAVGSHVDICDERLLAVEALLDVQARVMDYLTVQPVAFPQDGLLRSPNAEGTSAARWIRAWMWSAAFPIRT